jgi:diguanylate cyclase (GGDEF)-like protein
MSRPSLRPRPLTVFLVLILLGVIFAAAFPERVQRLGPDVQLVFLLLLGVTALLSLWSVHRLKRRVAQLSRVAEALRDGDYTARSSIEGVDVLAELSASLDQAAEHIETQVERLRTSEEQIRKMAYHDPLTELPNRRLFQELLDRELAQARRSRTVLGVVILDLDNFKDVNDSLGHALGDLLLIQVAHRLQQIIREADLVARLGGDEFALLLPGAKRPEDLLAVVQRVLSACRKPFRLDFREVLTSVSIGVSFFPQDGAGPETLIRNADSALYQSKHQGRNNLALFDPSMNQVVHKRLQLEQELRKALKGRQLSLEYQPLVSLDTGRIEGLEALARWDHTTRGRIGPDVFIPLAEETGLMPTLGLLVLELAGRQINAWDSQGLRSLPVSVNVSVRQLQTGDFVGSVHRVIDALGVAPDRFQFEITENIAADGVMRALDYISALNDLGVGVAIDDFGTGYSSFSYLMRYRIDTLKIDQTFIARIPGDSQCEAIVQAMISLGKNLGLRVIAEGIESQAQLEQLRSYGCHLGQGFLLGTPQAPEDLKFDLETGHISLSNRVPVA